MKKAYISIPITGYDLDERIKTAENIKKYLLDRGYAVYNPLENGLPHDAPYEQHMRRDISLLLKSDAIYMAKGWIKSHGCKIEKDVADICGIKIIYE